MMGRKLPSASFAANCVAVGQVCGALSMLRKLSKLAGDIVSQWQL